MTQHTETYDGTGGQRLALRHAPGVSVERLTIDGLEIPHCSSKRGEGAGYFLWGGSEVQLRGYIFTRSSQNVVVTYTTADGAEPAAGINFSGTCPRTVEITDDSAKLTFDDNPSARKLAAPSSAALRYAHDVCWPDDRIDLARLCEQFAIEEARKP